MPVLKDRKKNCMNTQIHIFMNTQIHIFQTMKQYKKTKKQHKSMASNSYCKNMMNGNISGIFCNSISLNSGSGIKYEYEQLACEMFTVDRQTEKATP